ncbi:hypothetical protein ScPMuIL_006227 [Solemya velum]
MHRYPIMFLFVCTLILTVTHVFGQHCYYINSETTVRCFDCPVGTWGASCSEPCSNSCSRIYYRTSPNGALLQSRLCDSDSNNCYRCGSGRYGPNCQLSCDWRCDSLGCDSDSGNCFRCDSGYYGLQCSSTCSAGCSSNTCDQVTGNCSPCWQGYDGDKCSCVGDCDGNGCVCTSCAAGFYGNGCSSKCPANCDYQGCYSYNGNCYTCKTGWAGNKCTSCAAGFYGNECNSRCPTNCNYQGCDRDSGDCYTCKTGWGGDKCTNCAAGYYGNGCSSRCPNNCDSQGCDRYSGNCYTCKTGWAGYKCTSCAAGFYGNGCSSKCPANCDYQGCYSYNGNCYTCKTGWAGNKCTSCAAGFYGNDCSSTCPANCDNQGCDRNNGNCTGGCTTGWYGDHCQHSCSVNCTGGCVKNDGRCTSCKEGSFGDLCDLICNVNCKEERCDRNGVCSGGCVDGWTGQTCSTPCNITNCLQCEMKGVSNTTTCTKCAVPYTGDECGQECPVNCLGCDSIDSCTACRDGFFGSTCGQNCSSHCTECSRGSYCTKCEDGWYRKSSSNGYYCVQCKTGCSICSSDLYCQECIRGWYKNSYSCYKCSSNCTLCSSGFNCEECDPGWYVSTGRCQTCPDPCTECHSADNCTVCREGWEGARCQCSIHCDEGLSRCDDMTGKCTEGCELNYYGENCNKQCEDCQTCDQFKGICTSCRHGYFGLQCNQSCSTGCLADGDAYCNITTGYCLSGCQTGYTGTTCAEPLQLSSEPDKALGIGVGVGVSLLLLIAIISVLFFILFRRRRRMRDTEGKGSDMVLDRIPENGGPSTSDHEELENSTELHSLLQRPEHNIVNNSPLKMPLRATLSNEEEEDEAPVEIASNAEYYNLPSMKPIDVDELLDTVLKKKAENAFVLEHEKLPKGLIESYKETLKPGNNGKCRYKTIYPYDHSRVVLELDDGNPNTDFINACYIDGYDKEKAYVASQGPVEAMKIDFWRMVWQLDSGIIIMLTNLSEEGKMKCIQYWPDPDMVHMFDKLHIRTLDEEEFANFIIRTLEIKKKVGVKKERIIKQFHFTSWPDRGVPKTVTALIDFRNKVCSTRVAGKGPLIVHCSAGVGRTGTFIGLDYLLHQGQNEKKVDIFSFVNKMRHQRPYMVQTPEQYEFLYDALVEALSASNSMVPSAEFHGYYLGLKTIDPETGQTRLQQQFKTLANSFSKVQFTVANQPENKGKNRYSNILPDDHSRVVLELDEGKPDTDFINACYIDTTLFHIYEMYIYYLSTGPLEVTLVDFWRMIWQLNSNIIVMLVNLREQGKTKCTQYWPELNTVNVVEKIRIRNIQEEQFAYFVIRTLEITKIGNEQGRIIKQFHFTVWPDKGMPKTVTGLIDFRNKVSSFRLDDKGPFVVHCSAGVGRTGIFIGLDYLINQGQSEESIDVFNMICKMRHQRPYMVQTSREYEFLYDALMEALSTSNSMVPSSEFRGYYLSLKTVDPETGQTGVQKQFKTIQKLSNNSAMDEFIAANKPENKAKNRQSNILADDTHRVILSANSSGSNYINAVWLPSYREKKHFVLTEAPQPSTVTDFWRMVYEQHCSTIVMMDNLHGDEESVGRYLPEKDKLTFGSFAVEIIERQETGEFLVTTVDLCYTTGMGPKTNRVKRFEFKAWAQNCLVPNSPAPILKMIEAILVWQRQTDNTPIVVHCMNGVERSGLFCAICYIIGRLKIDQEVHIMEAVILLKSIRHQIIHSQEQYIFCHEAVAEFLEEFNAYSKFI